MHLEWLRDHGLSAPDAVGNSINVAGVSDEKDAADVEEGAERVNHISADGVSKTGAPPSGAALPDATPVKAVGGRGQRGGLAELARQTGRSIN
jgi:hypothetical protein